MWTYAKLRWLGAEPATVHLYGEANATTPASVLRKFQLFFQYFTTRTHHGRDHNVIFLIDRQIRIFVDDQF